MRRELVNFMGQSDQVKGYLPLSAAAYLERSRMGTEGVWATDAEIYAMAIMLETDINTLCEGQWRRFSGTGSLRHPSGKRPAIYLVNVQGVHYEVVTAL